MILCKIGVTALALSASVAAPSSSNLAAPERAGWAVRFSSRGTVHAQALAPAANGGAFVAGNADTDAWVARVGPRGRPRWEVALTGSGLDSLAGALATRDGGVLVAGSTSSSGAGGLDGWLAKLDRRGGIEWQRTYGGEGDDWLGGLAASPDGFYVAGTRQDPSTGFDAWVLELDRAGDVLWQESLGGTGDDFGGALAATKDGVAMAANSSSELTGGSPPGFLRPWLVQLDGDGASLWQRTYDVSGGDAWGQLVALPDGGFVACGEVLAFSFFRGDAWVVRLDARGEVLWDRRMGDSAGLGYDAAFAVRPTADGGFVVGGATGTAGPGGDDFWLLRLGADGALAWSRALGTDDFEVFGGLALARRGGLFVAGRSGDASLVLKLDDEGAGGARCLTSLATAPNEWTTPALVEDVAEVPVATSVVPAPATLVAEPRDGGAPACPRGPVRR